MADKQYMVDACDQKFLGQQASLLINRDRTVLCAHMSTIGNLKEEWNTETLYSQVIDCEEAGMKQDRSSEFLSRVLNTFGKL